MSHKVRLAVDAHRARGSRPAGRVRRSVSLTVTIDRKFGAFVLMVLLIGVSGLALAVNPTFNTIIQPGSQVLPAAYVVFTDGTSYFSRNGQTGAIDYSGGQFTPVLWASLDNTPNGGRVAIGVGTFVMNQGVTITTSVQLQGQGVGTNINANAVVGTAFEVKRSNVILSDFHLFGTSGASGIQVDNFDNVQISRVYMDGFDKGVDNFAGASRITVSDSTFTAMNYGIRFGGGAQHIASRNQISSMSKVAIEADIVTGVIISNNVIYNGVGLQFFGAITIDATSASVSNVNVIGNVIKFTSNPSVTVNAILLDAETSASIKLSDTIVAENNLKGGSFANVNNGIYTHGFSTAWNLNNVSITGNTVTGFSGACIQVTYSANVTASGNAVSGCTTAMSSASGFKVVFVANSGYNPQPFAYISAGASPFTYTNNDPYIESVCVSVTAATEIALIRNGVTSVTGMTLGCLVLYPENQIKVTYPGAAPTMFKVPQ